jgi:nucleotide-binding universal stress UspA family protein
MTHILCPVDFSASSRNALRHAALLAQRRRRQLTVLFVNDPLLASAAAAAAYDVKALSKRTDTELRQFVRRAVGSDAGTIACATALGRPAPEILKAVKRLKADLVVMGTHGLSGPLKWFLGSTTEHVLRTTGVPVLVVPSLAGRRGGRPTGQWPGRRVVVPIDLDRDAVAQARAAISAAEEFGAEVMLLHVVAPPTLPAWMGIDGGVLTRDRYDAAKAQLEHVAQRVGGGTKYRVLSGDPAAQIAACAADLRSGLVVLTLKRAGAQGPRRGSIAYRVLCTGGVPVLAVPLSRASHPVLK